MILRLKCNPCLLVLLILLISGCTYKFERSELIEGMYYPDGSVQLEGRPFESLDQLHSLTVAQPFRITELGLFTKPFFNTQSQRAYEYNHGGSTSFEACKAEIPGLREYCIPTLMLKQTGRFEYHERTLNLVEWIQDKPILSSFILIILIISIIIFNRYFQKKQNELLLQKQREKEAQKLRGIREEQLRKEKEIQRRKDIVLDIINNLYKETEKEVNKTLIPTLLNELYEILNGLHSDNLNELILNGTETDFNNIVYSITSELNRLKKLAFDAQARGFTDEENEYFFEKEDNNSMNKEKAFEIFGLKSNASKDEIKKAYRELVKKYNTDQRTHYEEHIKQILEEKMKELNSAKDYLSKLGLI